MLPSSGQCLYHGLCVQSLWSQGKVSGSASLLVVVQTWPSPQRLFGPLGIPFPGARLTLGWHMALLIVSV